MSIRVAIVDDHPAIQTGLVAVLTTPPDPALIVARVASVEDLEALTGAPAPDVVLLDLNLPRGLSGVAAVRHLASRYKVVVYTSETDPHRLLEARAAGASACLNKGVDNDTVRSLVTAVALGQEVFTAVDTEAMRQAVRACPAVELTPTQERVLDLMAEGLDNAAIRMRLGVSAKTVENHITAVYQQLRDAGVLGADPSAQDRRNVVSARRAAGFVVRSRAWRRGRSGKEP